MELFISLLPILIVGGLIFLVSKVFKKSERNAAARYNDFMARHMRSGSFGDCGESDCATCKRRRKV